MVTVPNTQPRQPAYRRDNRGVSSVADRLTAGMVTLGSKGLPQAREPTLRSPIGLRTGGIEGVARGHLAFTATICSALAHL